jgi:protein-tyrosine kinase
MNRMEEALRRARQDPRLPASPSALDGPTAETFAQEDASPVGADAAIELPTVPSPTGNELRVFSPEPKPIDPEIPGVLVSASENGSAAAWKFNPAVAAKIIVNPEVKRVTVEQYRRLAAVLHHAQCDSGIKVVMAASALAGEGKTLTAVNLALTLSESHGRRVLLIDADFRRPTLHDVFQVPNVSGLNEALKADADQKLTILEISPRLSLLPAGRPDPDPMSGLTSGRMRRIIEEAAGKFDWVVLDTPPIGLITDAHLLAAMVNVAVLVIQAGRTPVNVIQRAIESLDRGRVIGVVLNQVDENATTPGGKYGAYYSSYYGHTSGDGTHVEA